VLTFGGRLPGDDTGAAALVTGLINVNDALPELPANVVSPL
jgi:hypothetical protein